MWTQTVRTVDTRREKPPIRASQAHALPKGLGLPTGGATMPTMIETTVAKDTWSQTPQGWLLSKRVVRTHHMAARREDP